MAGYKMTEERIKEALEELEHSGSFTLGPDEEKVLCELALDGLAYRELERFSSLSIDEQVKEVQPRVERIMDRFKVEFEKHKTKSTIGLCTVGDWWELTGRESPKKIIK